MVTRTIVADYVVLYMLRGEYGVKRIEHIITQLIPGPADISRKRDDAYKVMSHLIDSDVARFISWL